MKVKSRLATSLVAAFVGLAAAATADAKSVVITLGTKPKGIMTGSIEKVKEAIKKSPLLRDRGIHAPAEKIYTRAEFRKAVGVLKAGDVLYINAHGGVVKRKYADGRIVLEPTLGLGLGRYYLKDIEEDMKATFRGKPPRLLMAVMDACMRNARDADYDIAQQAFGAEVVLGWLSYTNSFNHIRHMSQMLRKYLHPQSEGGTWARLQEDPGEGTEAAESGKPYAYPREYYGWTMNEVSNELKGGCPQIDGVWTGTLKFTKVPHNKKEFKNKTRRGNKFQIIQADDPCKADIDFCNQINYGGMTARIPKKSTDLYKISVGAPGLKDLPSMVGILRYTFAKPNEEHIKKTGTKVGKAQWEWKRTSNLIWVQIDLYHHGFGKNNDRMMEIKMRQERGGQIWESRGVLSRR